jgi:hypothetical protein
VAKIGEGPYKCIGHEFSDKGKKLFCEFCGKQNLSVRYLIETETGKTFGIGCTCAEKHVPAVANSIKNFRKEFELNEKALVQAQRLNETIQQLKQEIQKIEETYPLSWSAKSFCDFAKRSTEARRPNEGSVRYYLGESMRSLLHARWNSEQLKAQRSQDLN